MQTHNDAISRKEKKKRTSDNTNYHRNVFAELKDAMMIFETTVVKIKDKPFYENRLSIFLDHAQA